MKKLLFICACMALVVAVDAEVITFKDGYTNSLSGGALYDGTQDAALYGNYGNRNDGIGISILAGNFIANGGGDRTSLLRFDLSSLTDSLEAGESIQINSASLYFRVTQTKGIGTATLSLFEVTTANAEWIEGTNSFFPRYDGSASWDHLAQTSINGGTVWAGSAGLGTAGTDYIASAVASVDVTLGTEADQVFNESISASLVQGWIDNAANNGGLLFDMPDHTEGESTAIYSSEYSVLSIRPALTIDYTVVPKSATVLSIR